MKMGEIKGKTGPAEDAGKFGLWSDKWEEDRTVYFLSSIKMWIIFEENGSSTYSTYVVKVLSGKGALGHADKKIYPIFFIA